MTTDPARAALPDHGRFPYRAITDRPAHGWVAGPGERARLAIYLGFNLEHFAFGEGLGAKIGAAAGEPDVLNYSWRDYGNRVGAWRCLELFDRLELPTACILNTALYDHAPDLVAAFGGRGDELVGHGHTNAARQSELDEAAERALLAACRDRIAAESGTAPAGWLSPWIAETHRTPDLLAETGYCYTLNWAHDDQPVRMRTRGGEGLWSIPYPQELNDIPMIVGRTLDGAAFATMIEDNLAEMLEQSTRQPLVMGIALHPYLVGQPYRLRHLARALEAVARARDAGVARVTTPGAICRRAEELERGAG